MLEIKKKKHTVTEMKNAFDGLITRLDTAEERLSATGCLNRIFKNQKAKRTKTDKNRTEYPRAVGQIKRCKVCVVGIPEGEERGT